MTRRVVPAAEVAHFWANKAQDDARTPTGNLYFVGPSIFSYGHHYCIAHHLSDEIILWNSSSTTSTTNGHKWDVRKAMDDRQNACLLEINGMSEDTVRRIERNKGCKEFDFKVGVQYQADIERLVHEMKGMRVEHKIFATHNGILKIDSNATRLAHWFKAKWKCTKPISPEELRDKTKRVAWCNAILKVAAKAKIQVALVEAQRAVNHLAKHAEQNSIYGLDNWLNTVEMSVNRVKLLESTFSKTMPQWKKLDAQMAPLRIEIAAVLLERDLTTAAFDIEAAYDDVQATSLEDHVANGIYLRDRADRDKFCSWVKLLQVHNKDSKYDEILTKAGVVLKRLDEMQVLRTENMLIDRTRFINNTDEAASDRLRHLEGIKEQLKAYEGGNHDVLELKAFYSETHLHLQLMADEQAKNAIQNWIDGKPGGAVPYDCKTLVRIKNGRVETSKGATVSLDEAIKLARVARRIINAGGKDWTTPAQVMPHVGPYRVRRIGADGSATIGCHEFTAEVGMAAITMLENMKVEA